MTRAGLVLFAALWVPVALASPAYAAMCRDVQFPDSVTAAGGDLVLNGLGIRKATLLSIKVYVAGLYLPQKSPDAAGTLRSHGRLRLSLRFGRHGRAGD